MPYDPNRHHRRSIRLKGYDYSQAGLYFITITLQHGRCLFGTIQQQQMLLNEFGTIAHQQWEALPKRYHNIEEDVFQIMPNHIHGILLLTLPDWAGASPAPTVGNITGAYKSIVANCCLEIFKCKYPGKTMGKLWQRDYYEHIIRNEQSLLNITNYIIANPSNWDQDPFYNM